MYHLYKQFDLQALLAYVEIARSAAVPFDAFALIESGEPAEALAEVSSRIAVPPVDLPWFLLLDRMLAVLVPREIDWGVAVF